MAANYEEAFKHIPDIFCIINTDEDLTIAYANNAFYDLIGYTAGEVQYRFGNRMSALLESDTVKQLKSFNMGNKRYCSILEHTVKNSRNEEVYLCTTVNCFCMENETVMYLISKDISEHRKTEQRLMKLQNKTDYIYQYSDFDIVEFDYYTGKIQGISSKMFFTGILHEGDIFFDCALQRDIVKDASLAELQECINKITDGNSRALCQLQMKDINGQYQWVMMSLGVQENGRAPYVIGVFTNVTTEKEAALNYLYEALFYQAVLSNQNAYGHVNVTEDRLMRVGGMWAEYNDSINDKSYSELFKQTSDKMVHPDERAQYWGMACRENLLESYENGISSLGCEFRRVVSSNKMIWMSITIHMFEDPLQHDVLAVMYLKNIDIQKKQRIALEFAANRDALTKVFNKEITQERITEHTLHMGEQEICFFLIFDIVNLKTIYETYGNEAGDRVLVKIARILRVSFRKCDIVGRYGRNKFILYLKDVAHDKGIKERLDKVTLLLKEDFNPEIQTRIGITAVYRNDTYEKIWNRACSALESCKCSVGGQYEFYGDLPESFASHHIEKKKQEEINQIISSHTTEIDMLSKRFHYDEDTVDFQLNSFDQMVSEQGEMCYLVDPISYEMVHVNKAFCDRLGMSEEECKEGKCFEVVHQRSAPCPFCQKSNWSTGKFCFYRNYNEVLQQEFLIKNKLIDYNGREMLFAIAVDLSENDNATDSIGNEATENDYLLSGIHYMQNSKDFHGMMINAMETIGTFFRAQDVHFWNLDQQNYYAEAYSWQNAGEMAVQRPLDETEKRHIDQWLKDWKGNTVFDVDNQEIMLYHSFSMHELIKKKMIFNQKWVLLVSHNKKIGFFEINNISANFQNNSFIESFVNFIASEWKQRAMVDDIIMSNYYDSLTGLLNRTSYENYLRQYNADNRETMAVVILNINRMGDINESQGFGIGNSYLKKLASLLVETFDQQSTYRINGDEFILFLEDMEQDLVEENIAKLRQKLKSEEFSVSIGYSFDNVEKHLDQLIEFAAQSMRVNKKIYYDSVNINKDEERVNMQKQLIESIENDLVKVYLQPKINIEQNQVIGAEALIRFFNASKGFAPPGNTIGILEKMNLIRYIDLFVFEEVCRTLDKWRSIGIQVPRISLNFSRMTMMEADLINSMQNIVSQYRVDKEKIEIEITESYADIGKAYLYQAAKKISNAGYTLSLDDFGTDYTNLSILSDLDVDVLKVDRSLVHSLAYRKKDQVILKSVIQMCKDLNVEVVAEGVETREQENIIRRLGGNLIQGYLYSKPVPIEDFERDFLGKFFLE